MKKLRQALSTVMGPQVKRDKTYNEAVRTIARYVLAENKRLGTL